MRFLDVAAGSGALSIPAARLARGYWRPTSRRSCWNCSRSVRARRNSTSRPRHGWSRTRTRRQQLRMAGSQFGVMLFPDMPKGIREMARVVKPGRPRPDDCVWRSAQDRVLRLFRGRHSVCPSGFRRSPMDPPPLPFQLRDPERLHKEFAAAGLKDIMVKTITESTEFRTGKELWGVGGVEVTLSRKRCSVH